MNASELNRHMYDDNKLGINRFPSLLCPLIHQVKFQ